MPAVLCLPSSVATHCPTLSDHKTRQCCIYDTLPDRNLIEPTPGMAAIAAARPSRLQQVLLRWAKVAPISARHTAAACSTVARQGGPGTLGHTDGGLSFDDVDLALLPEALGQGHSGAGCACAAWASSYAQATARLPPPFPRSVRVRSRVAWRTRQGRVVGHPCGQPSAAPGGGAHGQRVCRMGPRRRSGHTGQLVHVGTAP